LFILGMCVFRAVFRWS